MQKLASFLICVVMCCAGFIARAQSDTPAQVQAREALRKKMAELNAQGSAAETPAPTPASPRKMKTEPTFKALPATQAPATVAPTPAPAVAAPPLTVFLAPSMVTMPSDKAALLREALRQKMAELNAQKAAGQPTSAPLYKSPGETTGANPPVYAPIQAPPLAVSSSKEARLAELLQKYKADIITPEQYHEARAKILAEP